MWIFKCYIFHFMKSRLLVLLWWEWSLFSFSFLGHGDCKNNVITMWFHIISCGIIKDEKHWTTVVVFFFLKEKRKNSLTVNERQPEGRDLWNVSRCARFRRVWQQSPCVTSSLVHTDEGLKHACVCVCVWVAEFNRAQINYSSSERDE